MSSGVAFDTRDLSVKATDLEERIPIEERMNSGPMVDSGEAIEIGEYIEVELAP